MELTTPATQWDYSIHQWASTNYQNVEKMTTTTQKSTLMSQLQ